MARLIAILVLLVILAILIALNLPYRTTVDIFGWRLEDAPSIIVIIASVALGIVVSIAVYVVSHLGKRRKHKLKTRTAVAEERVRELGEGEKTQGRIDEPGAAKPRVSAEAGPEPAAAADREAPARPTGFGGRLRRFFGG